VDTSRLTWPPSGERPVYLAYDGTERDYPGVFLIRPDGSDRRQLNRPGNVATDPSWIPR
jgi:Tol biopolymer transport system component